MSITADYGLWLPPTNFSVGTLNNFLLIFIDRTGEYNECRHIRSSRARDGKTMG